MKKISHSQEETKQIASEFAKTLEGGEVILLDGDLGSGKTTFVQGLTQHFGFTDPVRSPTFTIMNIYEVEHSTIKRIVHMDFYRLKDPHELHPLGLEEWLGMSDTVVLIEWPREEMVIDPKWKMVHIRFDQLGEQERSIKIK